MSEVSTCCGCSFEESTIADCCSVEMYKDYESDICPRCKGHTEATGYICNECGNWFEHTEDKTEWEERMEENHYEEKADAMRKYGE